MQRRKFTIIVSLATVGVLTPIQSCNSDKFNINELLMSPNSLLRIMGTDEIKKIGVEYLEKFPHEEKVEVLVKLIYNYFPDKISDLKLKTLIEEKIKIDFETNSVVVLNGWVLSKTEARQCALYSKT